MAGIGEPAALAKSEARHRDNAQHPQRAIEEARSSVKSTVAQMSEQYRARAEQIGISYQPDKIEAHQAAAAEHAYDDYRRRVLVTGRDTGLDDAIRWAQSDYAGGLDSKDLR